MEGRDGDRLPYFGRARIAAGLVIAALVVILALADAASPEYSLDSIILGLLLGASLLFLGIEAGRGFLR